MPEDFLFPSLLAVCHEVFLIPPLSSKDMSLLRLQMFDIYHHFKIKPKIDSVFNMMKQNETKLDPGCAVCQVNVSE